MKPALFLSLGIFPSPQARTATEVRAGQNLAALRALGYDVTVLTTPDPLGRPGPDFPTLFTRPLPVTNFVEFHAQWRYRREVGRLINQNLAGGQSLLFCEHWAALACSPRGARIIYSMHDFESKLVPARRLRKGAPVTFKTRAYWRLARCLELRLVNKARKVIAVSATEADEAARVWRVPAVYIPTVSVAMEKPVRDFLDGAVRCWFYGSSSATSNKIVLDHLADGCFAALKAAMPNAEFHQAGSFEHYDPGKIAWLKEHFTVHGFVEDPAQFFCRGDFCLIPYQQDTGFRTKIPEVCGYGMIAAGYPASFACCPEMRDGYNCVIADSPTQLAGKLAQVAADPAWRRRLSEGAFATRCHELSFSALLDRYRQALDF